MAEHDTKNLSQQEELSAYLDGELDVGSVRRVEERLARDAPFRAELHRLQRAWDLLDRLPRSTVNESFSKSTIEMVALAASQEAQAVQSDWPRRLRTRRWMSIGGVAAAGLIGFLIGQWLWPDPNAQLLHDLPVIENFELYYQADNLEFLRMLEREGLFAEGENEHAG